MEIVPSTKQVRLVDARSGCDEELTSIYNFHRWLHPAKVR